MIFQVGKTSRSPACIKIKKKKKTPLKREENLRWKDAGTEEDRKGKWMLLLGTTFIISSKMYMSATKEMDMNGYEWI